MTNFCNQFLNIIQFRLR